MSSSTATLRPEARQPRQRTRSASRTRTRSRSTSVFEEKPHSPPPEGCICLRPHVLVFCKSCGWMVKKGRTRISCPVHVRTFYLLDIDRCPRCSSYPPILSELQQ